ncbi:DUF6894 family protein [Rhizobium sp. WSM1325]|uniref:DUF6894 family protein n=1 Tax=Rhizobium sp. WSM1325 TaxID=3444086 RepID=UPI003D7C1E9A
METFFSHLNFLREFVVDPEGSQFHDLATAGSEARQAIRDMAAERLKDRRQFTLWSIRICDDQNRLVAEVFAPEALTEVISPMFWF